MTFKVICRKEISYKNFTSPLCLLFFQGKRKKAVGLGVSVAPEHWDAEAQKVTGESPDRDAVQFQITAKVKEYEKKIQKLEALDIPVTFENLFEQNSKRLNCSIGDYLKQTIERLETLGKLGSASKHRSLPLSNVKTKLFYENTRQKGGRSSRVIRDKTYKVQNQRQENTLHDHYKNRIIAKWHELII